MVHDFKTHLVKEERTMALNGCYSCLKFLVFTINFLLWLFGLGVVAVSLWLLFDSDLYLQTMSDQRTDYYLGTYIILAIGSLVTIMGKKNTVELVPMPMGLSSRFDPDYCQAKLSYAIISISPSHTPALFSLSQSTNLTYELT